MYEELFFNEMLYSRLQRKLLLVVTDDTVTPIDLQMGHGSPDRSNILKNPLKHSYTQQ